MGRVQGELVCSTAGSAGSCVGVGGGGGVGVGVCGVCGERVRTVCILLKPRILNEGKCRADVRDLKKIQQKKTCRAFYIVSNMTGGL